MTVVDNVAPVITCPANIVASYCNPSVTFSLPSVTDNCSFIPVSLVQTAGLPSGADFPVGLTTQSFSYADAAGNSATCSFTVAVSAPANVTTSSTNVTCNAACNGTASVSINGGVPPFNVAWSNGTTGTNATNLCAGTYEVTVTDNAGCLQTVSFTITEPTALQLTVDNVVNDVNSTGVGAVQISLTGGTTPYTYAWTLNGQPVAATTQDLANIQFGNYQVEVTDANGCTIVSNDIIVQNITGTSEPTWSESAALQPNPASSYTTLVLRKQITERLEVQVYDVTGKVVSRQSFDGQADKITLDLAGFAPGVYNVQFRTVSGMAVRKLVVNR